MYSLFITGMSCSEGLIDRDKLSPRRCVGCVSVFSPTLGWRNFDATHNYVESHTNGGKYGGGWVTFDLRIDKSILKKSCNDVGCGRMKWTRPFDKE